MADVNTATKQNGKRRRWKLWAVLLALPFLYVASNGPTSALMMRVFHDNPQSTAWTIFHVFYLPLYGLEAAVPALWDAMTVYREWWYGVFGVDVLMSIK